MKQVVIYTKLNNNGTLESKHYFYEDWLKEKDIKKFSLFNGCAKNTLDEVKKQISNLQVSGQWYGNGVTHGCCYSDGKVFHELYEVAEALDSEDGFYDTTRVSFDYCVTDCYLYTQGNSILSIFYQHSDDFLVNEDEWFVKVYGELNQSNLCLTTIEV